MPTRHHVKTLTATSSRPNPEMLAEREVLAYPHVMFHPFTCGLRRDTATIIVALIDYGDARSLLERGREGGDQLLTLH
jgi:hypothetical protein